MYRKGVSAIILNNKNEILIVNLQSFEEKYFAIPGGGLDKGETLKQAVFREISEELGIEEESLKLVSKSKKPLRIKFKVIKLNRDGREYKGSERHFFGLKFLGKDTDIAIDENEVRMYKWVSLEKLKGYLLFDNQLQETKDMIFELFPSLR